MRVCDKHHDREAIDTLHVQNDGTQIDMCHACKEAVLGVFTKQDKKPDGLLKKVFGKPD